MTTVGFIGLGIMGAPMAINLVKAGHEVVGYNLHPEPIERLLAAGGRGGGGGGPGGGRGAGDGAEAVAGADIVITMLPDSPDVEGVALGENGVFANADAGLLYIDASTIRPDVSARIAAAGAKRGIRVVDAPVSGGEQGAVEGNLSIMVGGSAEDFEAARPLLEVVGRTVVHVGPPGAGQTVKAANQLIVAGTIELVAESIVFLEAHGVDLDAAIKVLAG